jgi:Tol biopolymer transport system component
VLERCLQKKPADRYRDIGDVKADLQRVLADPQGVIVAPVAPAPVEARPGLRASLPLVAATAAVCLVVAGAAGWFLRPAPAPEPRPVLRFPLPLPEGQSLLSPAGTIAISRDGTQVAYAAGTQLYLRRLGETEARPVPGAEAAGIGVAAPAFSPDGQWLAYVDASSLAGPFIVKRIPVTGGTPVPVFEAAAYIDGLSWPTAETMLFADTGEDAGIVRIPANGGAAEVLVAALDGEVLNGPQLLPGEEAVLFSRLPRQPLAPNRWNAAQIAIQSIGGDDRSIVWEGASAARYVPSGHLLYAQGATLFALAFDLESRTVSGGAVPIVEGVQRSVNGLSDTGGYALSDTGTLATVPGTVAVAAEAGVLAYVDRAGAVEALPVRPGQYRSPRVSPDGTQLAVEVLDASDQEGQIWIYDLSGNSQLRRLTQTGNNTRAIWGPDSQRVTFASQQNGAWGIYDQPADGSALAEQLLAVEQGPAYPESWSPDGQTLLFTDATTQGEWTVWTVTRSGGTAELLAGEVANHFGAVFSPDGRWVAYTGVDDAAGTGLVGVRVQPFPPHGCGPAGDTGRRGVAGVVGQRRRALLPAAPGHPHAGTVDGTRREHRGRVHLPEPAAGADPGRADVRELPRLRPDAGRGTIRDDRAVRADRGQCRRARWPAARPHRRGAQLGGRAEGSRPGGVGPARRRPARLSRKERLPGRLRLVRTRIRILESEGMALGKAESRLSQHQGHARPFLDEPVDGQSQVTLAGIGEVHAVSAHAPEHGEMPVVGSFQMDDHRPLQRGQARDAEPHTRRLVAHALRLQSQIEQREAVRLPVLHVPEGHGAQDVDEDRFLADVVAEVVPHQRRQGRRSARVVEPLPDDVPIAQLAPGDHGCHPADHAATDRGRGERRRRARGGARLEQERRKAENAEPRCASHPDLLIGRAGG